MPKSTFNNLNESKKSAFINEALKEFAHNDFQSASITTVVKNLRIAKGSVYQYFDDKLDLWLFLKHHAEQTKLLYIKSVKREDFPDFWGYFKALYTNGINFDLEHPLCSLLLYRIGFKESSPQVQPYLNDWKIQAKEMFINLIKKEQINGSFDSSLSPEIAAHFLATVSMSIAELMQNRYQVNFDENIKKGLPLFGKNKKELLQAVEELVKLLKKALK